MQIDQDKATDESGHGRGIFFTIFWMVALLAVWGLAVDIYHTAIGGSIDLRNRITGARLAADHRDPYFYKWQHEDGDRLCDPYNAPGSPVSHTTVTPLLLTAYMPLNSVKYGIIQWLWLGTQYLCLALGFRAWAKICQRDNILWGGFFTLFYCLSPHWRLHIDRGQSYVLYAALMLSMVQCATNGGRQREWLAGLTSAALFALRPIYGLLLGVPLAERRRHMMAAMLVGLVIVIVLPMTLAGADIWNSYFKAMAVHSERYLTQVKTPAGNAGNLAHLEGIPLETITAVAYIPFSDTSIYRLLSWKLSPALLLSTWALLAAGAGTLMVRRHLTGQPVFWWAISAWIVVGDYLLPAYRYNYNHILLWPLLLLGLSALRGRARKIWIAISSSLLAAHGLLWFFTGAFLPVPGMLTLAMACGVIIWTLTAGSIHRRSPLDAAPRTLA